MPPPTRPLAVLLVLLFAPAARGQGTRADYDRSARLDALTRGKVFNATVTPHWSADGNSFWYVTDGPDHQRHRWVVDAVAGTRRAATGDDAPAVVAVPKLPGVRPSRNGGGEADLTFVNRTAEPVTLYWVDTAGDRKRYAVVAPGQRYRESTYVGHVWLVTDPRGGTLGAYAAPDGGGEVVVEAAPPTTAPTTAPAADVRPVVPPPDGWRSPDGRWVAAVVDYNLVLRNVGTGAEVKLTTDGHRRDGYGDAAADVVWSPDSAHVVALRTVDGAHRMVEVVRSSPPGRVQPFTESFEYAKPGDRIPITKPHLFDVSGRREVPVDDALFQNPWDGRGCNVRWAADGRRFTFTYNQRGHQVLRVVAVDAATGAATAVVDEQSKTFIDYAGKMFLRWLGDRELVWMSERDGWNHLYLYDATTGRVATQITRGGWVVRTVDHVDPVKRQVWFTAGGLDPQQDPYYVHVCRVNLDGTGLLDLTPADGTHKVQWSPDRRFYVDTYSRVDLSPVSELRRGDDGSLVRPLESADATELLATGWRYPERFTAKGRDGSTDIYGVVYRPTNFDPAKKYPVIEDVYAGPQDSFVPKAFTRRTGGMAMAELGFIVVQIDGMGTSNRSKAFHDVCWHNLGDGGFPDRIAWIRAAAAKHPEMDLGRGVGIYGTSAGGQNALRAVEAFGNFYTAAVADCGCHDNRMDKIWWNELWMGWPVGPWYAEQSNVTNARDLHGALLLIVGEADHNVDPASTMQVVNALVKADKDFDLLVIPNADHGQDGPYGDRRRKDFFVRHLLGVEPRRR